MIQKHYIKYKRKTTYGYHAKKMNYRTVYKLTNTSTHISAQSIHIYILNKFKFNNNRQIVVPQPKIRIFWFEPYNKGDIHDGQEEGKALKRSTVGGIPRRHGDPPILLAQNR